MLSQNHYSILQIPMSASAQEVKKAYRNLARKHHPDKSINEENATHYFQQIQAAYDTLSNPIKRSQYDKELIKDGQYNPFAKQNQNDAASVLVSSEKLLNYLSSQNHISINKDALADYILALLNAEQQQLLLRENNTEINELIVANLLKAANCIEAPRLFDEISIALQCLIPSKQNIFFQKLENEKEKRKVKERQNKIVPIAAIAIVIIVFGIMMMILS